MDMTRTRFFRFAIYTILVLIIIYLIWLTRPILSVIWAIIGEVAVPFLVGLLVAYLLHPVIELLEKRKVPRLVAVLLIYLLFVLIITVALINAIPAFTTQLIELSDDLPRLTKWYQVWMQEWEAHKYFLPDSIQSGVDRVIIQSQERMSMGISEVVNNARNTLGKLVAYAVVPFIAFYMLKDMKDINRGFMMLIPHKYRKQAAVVFRDINTSLGKYIHGQIVVAVIVGVLAFLGYWLIGMPYPFVLASFVALTNIIPYIGPLIGAIPALIVALTISVKQVVFVLIMNMIVQVLEGNILSPNIVGKSLHLHPLMIIFALLAGETVGGIVGMIFAVPVLAVVKVVVGRVAVMVREG
ncbi:AI-2E family transporter [Brevibacillus dissolubilis]|uniref:AI-2E family transporter n=1 Tax=Brevibacillus dissolubilis TaxID=1844116 RepID=UPI0011175BCD|nr:AI-2E family transporter [Brevibacillus dissolubilis]